MTKFAIMLNASTTDIGPMANGLEYALDLDDHDHEVAVYFDGIATRWPGHLDAHPDNRCGSTTRLPRSGLIGGACGYCAYSFDCVEGVESAGIPLLGGEDEHGSHLGEVVDAGFEVLTVG